MAPVSRVVMQKYLVDVVRGISFFLCFVTGIAKLPGAVMLLEWAAIDLPWGRIDRFHDAIGVVMGLSAPVHLALNRKWPVSVTRILLGRT
ncbi:MAG TPA: hypothetical protein ENN85_02860 [Methanoculleus sp.]|nr:hypothetical protein [Methanoculleus sp.]